jgi:hypothetical protein
MSMNETVQAELKGMAAWVVGIDAREELLRAYWEDQHGPWNARGEWPPHPKPPCFDCWSSVLYDHNGHQQFETIPNATTLFDAHEGRYLVCEPCWRKRMRGSGYTDADLREILMEQGGFSAEEADGMLAEDATTPPPAGPQE